jgi:hypothetical protein
VVALPLKESLEIEYFWLHVCDPFAYQMAKGEEE